MNELWFQLVKNAYDRGNPLYTNEGIRGFVSTRKITADQYEEITGIKY